MKAAVKPTFHCRENDWCKSSMNPVILKGTKQEIVDSLVNMPAEVNEAIVFVAEPQLPGSPVSLATNEDIFAEMLPYMVEVGDMDDSRNAIYTRQAGE